MSTSNFLPKSPASASTKPQPIVARDLLNDFTLYNFQDGLRFYYGDISWLKKMVSLNLNLDEDETSFPDKALAHFLQIADQAEQWDARLRQAALQYMANSDGTVDIWGYTSTDVPSTISSEEFLHRISLCLLSVFPNGDLFFEYDPDQMFDLNSLGIEANVSGEIGSCGLEG